jgi:hypothetical protein
MSLRDEAKIGVEPCEAVKREFTASEASKPLIDRRKEAYRFRLVLPTSTGPELIESERIGQQMLRNGLFRKNRRHPPRPLGPLGRIQQLVLLDLTQLINQLLHADPRPSRLRLLVDRLQ